MTTKLSNQNFTTINMLCLKESHRASWPLDIVRMAGEVTSETSPARQSCIQTHDLYFIIWHFLNDIKIVLTGGKKAFISLFHFNLIFYYFSILIIHELCNSHRGHHGLCRVRSPEDVCLTLFFHDEHWQVEHMLPHMGAIWASWLFDLRRWWFSKHRRASSLLPGSALWMPC